MADQFKGFFFQEQEIFTPLLAPYPPRIPPELKDDPKFNEKFYIQLTLVNVLFICSVIILAVWIILTNAIIIIGLLRKQPISPTDYYLINLNVMDVFVGFLVVPFMGIVKIVGYFPFKKTVCHVWVFSDYFLTVGTSFGSLVLMLNYLLMVRFPGIYRRFKKPQIFITIAMTWFLALICWIPAYLNNLAMDYPKGVCGYNTNFNHYYTLYLGIIGFFIPLVISIISAIYSCIILQRKIPDRLFYITPLQFDKTSSPVSRKRVWSRGVIFERITFETNYILSCQALARKHIGLIMWMFGLFLICRVIFYFYFAIGAFMEKVFPRDLSNGLYWIMHSNAAINPIIHLVFDSELRLEIKGMFCRKNLVKPFISSSEKGISSISNNNLPNILHKG